jgi:hypothetical protein
MMLAIMTIVGAILVMAIFDHVISGSFMELGFMPKWLCIFCWIEKILEVFENG